VTGDNGVNMNWPGDYLIPRIEPYHVEDAGIIYNADCRDIIPHLPKVDLVFTSPPYNLGNFNKGSHYAGKFKKGTKLTYKDHSDSMNEKEYIEWQHMTIKLLFEHINDNGAIFYNHKPRINKGVWDDRKNLIPLPIRQTIIWDRCCMVNFNGTFYAPSTERIYIIAKTDWKPNKEYVGLGEIWRVPPETDNPHPAPFPVKLAKRVIESASPLGGVCLDNYFGSGTLAVAAKELGRKFIGIEISEEYCAIAVKRLRQGVLNFG
jgi:site-specific DNA-methyltransferase (adenine-specific)